VVPSDEARQRVVDALCEAFAEDLVSVEEFERRVETAHQTASDAELRALLSDLPRPARPPARATGGPGTATHPLAPVDPADRTFALPPMAAPHEVSENAFAMGILGGGSKGGRWIPARTNWTVGIMGGVELDFREAYFAPGVTEVRALAFWGGVDIIAPPSVRVEVSGIGLMGGFEHKATTPPNDHPDAPTLRITGVACMGGVGVSVRYPGESSRDARKRLKERRKELKQLRRGGGQ
jgi:hypothetical protein